MAAYRRVYDSRHLQADCQEPGSFRNSTLGNRVWATFTFTLDDAHIDGGVETVYNMRSRIYETVERPSVRPSVRQSVYRKQQRLSAGLLLSAPLTGDIDR